MKSPHKHHQESQWGLPCSLITQEMCRLCFIFFIFFILSHLLFHKRDQFITTLKFLSHPSYTHLTNNIIFISLL